ncbi:unnamed protein product [Didymodactylos carnosus]|nr:unnamed protein product [Didymodactylos carnosus]CAF3762756.1 unnamed protein product [Didymodactylos carnosus]
MYVASRNSFHPPHIITGPTPTMWATALLTYPQSNDSDNSTGKPLPLLPADDTFFEYKFLKPLQPKLASPAVKRVKLFFSVVWNSSRGDALEEWQVNGITFEHPKEPLLQANFLDGTDRYAVADSRQGRVGNVHETYIEYFEFGQVYEIVMINEDPQQHPWHLHGYTVDFVAAEKLEAGTDCNGISTGVDMKTFDYDSVLPSLNSSAPVVTVGDSWNLPRNSYVAFRFKADNPGPWLLHCHMDWHIAPGLALVFSVGENGTYKNLLQPPPADFQIKINDVHVKYLNNYLKLLIKQKFSKYFKLYKNTIHITTADNIAIKSSTSNNDNLENLAFKNNNNEEKQLSICQYYKNTFNVILTVAFQTLLYNDMCESNDLQQFKTTLINFKNYLTPYFSKHENMLSIKNFTVVRDHELCLSILVIIWHLVDKPIFESVFIETDYAKAVLDWIQLSTKRKGHKRELVNIVHNLIRQKQGQNAFKQENVIFILDEICSTFENCRDDEMIVVYYMGSILIDGHELIETFLKEFNDSIKHILNRIFNMNLRACCNLIKYKELLYYNFHLSELLIVLERLFISDFIVKYFLTDNESEIDRASTHHSSSLSLSSSSSSISSLTPSSISSIFLQDNKKDSIKIFSDALLSIYGRITDGDNRGKLACELLMKIL